MSEPIRPVTMPKWGLAMVEGMVSGWHAEVGASVEKGQELVDIETEKITNVFESPAAGMLRRRLVDAGEVHPVGALLAVLADDGVTDSEIDSYVEDFNARFAEVLATREAEGVSGPEPQSVEVAGRGMRHLAMGEGEATPLVLLHGFGGDLNNWLFNQPELAEHRPVHAVDLPGHGGSSKALEAGTAEALAEAVRGFLDAADLPRVHLAGHSLGGGIAALVAKAIPDRVASLTLVASVGLGPDIDMDYIRGFIGARRRKDLKPVIERLFADPSLVHREMLDEILKFKRLDGVTEVLEQIAASVFPGGRQAFSVREALPTLGVPVCVVWGAEDRIVPATHASGLEDPVVAHVIEGAGHMVHMEKAAEVNASIESTMARSG